MTHGLIAIDPKLLKTHTELLRYAEEDLLDVHDDIQGLRILVDRTLFEVLNAVS